MRQIGEVHEYGNGFNWKMTNFTCLSEGMYCSPSFTYHDTSWYLAICLNAYKLSRGYIHIFLTKEYSDAPISTKVSIGLKSVTGKQVLVRHCSAAFEEDGDDSKFPQFISRSELERRMMELVPFNVLTVMCHLKIQKSTGNESKDATAECFYCKEPFDVEIISSHEKKCRVRPIECPECSNVILLQNFYSHKCEFKRTKAKVATRECCHCRETFDVAIVSSHEKKCRVRPIECPDCSEVILLQNFSGHECQFKRTTGTFATAACLHCKETFDVAIVSSHEKKCKYRPIQCPDCSDVIFLQNFYGHKCEFKRSKGGIATAECSFCKETFNAQEISFHEKKCRIKCPKCSDVIPLKSWNSHECQQPKERCTLFSLFRNWTRKL